VAPHYFENLWTAGAGIVSNPPGGGGVSYLYHVWYQDKECLT
jgi:hypothetical protein